MMREPADPVEGPGGWYSRRTSTADDWPVDRLLTLKGTHRVSVVIPAHNEEMTVGHVVAGIRTDLMSAAPLVDELVVIDSDSTDDTADRAASAGAAVHAARDVRRDLGAHAGKGEALWKSQFVTSGDILVFIDADLTGWGTHFVRGLLGPLFAEPDVRLVKGFYDRRLDERSGPASADGGRVTELVVRPLINLYRPQLVHVVQPLAGEWAIRRDTFAQLTVPVGYGVELAALLDVHTRHGLPAIAQVDLGARAHIHQSVHDLGVMAAELIAVTHRRCGLGDPAGEAELLWQYRRDAGWQRRPVPLTERPPATTSNPAIALPTPGDDRVGYGGAQTQRRGRRIAMTDAERDQFLAEQRVCRVATVNAVGYPDVSPLWFVWDGDALWLNSTVRSQRWANVQRHPQVAIVVDAGDEYTELRGVEIHGVAEIVGDVPRTGRPDPALLRVELAYAGKYGDGVWRPDGRHAWLRVPPTKVQSWDFRRLDAAAGSR